MLCEKPSPLSLFLLWSFRKQFQQSILTGILFLVLLMLTTYVLITFEYVTTVRQNDPMATALIVSTIHL